MPQFRFITPPLGLEDAVYLYAENPDPGRFAEVEEAAPAMTEPPAEPTPEPPAPTEESA